MTGSAARYAVVAPGAPLAVGVGQPWRHRSRGGKLRWTRARVPWPVLLGSSAPQLEFDELIELVRGDSELGEHELEPAADEVAVMPAGPTVRFRYHGIPRSTSRHHYPRKLSPADRPFAARQAANRVAGRQWG
jgi:hypothetical protein